MCAVHAVHILKPSVVASGSTHRNCCIEKKPASDKYVLQDFAAPVDHYRINFKDLFGVGVLAVGVEVMGSSVSSCVIGMKGEAKFGVIREGVWFE